MKHGVWLALLIACGSGGKGTGGETLGNHAVAPPPEPTANCTLAGLVTDTAMGGEPAIGATIVASGKGAIAEAVVISDENGVFSLPVDGHDTLSVYYNDSTAEYHFDGSHCGKRIKVVTGRGGEVTKGQIVVY